jgi:hypothetical protein
MIEVFEDLQRLLDDAVALLALDVCHEADAARVMLLAGRIQAFCFQLGNLGLCGHGLLQLLGGTRKNTAAQQPCQAN